MRDARWFWAQLALAAVLLALALIGILGRVVFGTAAFTFGFGGMLHAFFVFPGLVLSLVVNAFVMRRHGEAGLSEGEEVLLGAEFALIAILLGLHFWDGGTGFAVALWPIVIAIAVAIVVVAGIRDTRLSAVRVSPSAR